MDSMRLNIGPMARFYRQTSTSFAGVARNILPAQHAHHRIAMTIDLETVSPSAGAYRRIQKVISEYPVHKISFKWPEPDRMLVLFRLGGRLLAEIA